MNFPVFHGHAEWNAFPLILTTATFDPLVKHQSFRIAWQWAGDNLLQNLEIAAFIPPISFFYSLLTTPTVVQFLPKLHAYTYIYSTYYIYIYFLVYRKICKGLLASFKLRMIFCFHFIISQFCVHQHNRMQFMPAVYRISHIYYCYISEFISSCGV